MYYCYTPLRIYHCIFNECNTSQIVDQRRQITAMTELAVLEEGMATHSSIHAWRIPTDRGAW